MTNPETEDSASLVEMMRTMSAQLTSQNQQPASMDSKLAKIDTIAGLWIRNHFLRIRIRIRIQWIRMEANTDPDTDPDPDPIRIQGFNDQKLKKNNS